MWYTNPKLWGTVITVILTILMMVTGMDVKKHLCESSAPAVESVKPVQP
jgi:hypothetical protein